VLRSGDSLVITADSRHAHRELEERLRPFVARRVSASDVDDVMQDIFLRMQKSVNALRDEQRFGPWIYQVARSAIAEQKRSRARYPIASCEPPDAPVDPPDVEDEGAAERALAATVAPFVSMLPSPYREALTLTELEGLTQREAAAMLGVSLPCMKSRVQRGREELRTVLELCCEIGVDARGRVIACEPRQTEDAYAAVQAACACEKQSRS
jgi:RNA polymerase sigma-70 factor (ECF subfamily)